MSETYSVVVTGKIVAGFEMAQVKANVGNVFKLTESQVEKMFCGKPVAIKRGVPKDQAAKIRSILVKAGALAVVKANKDSDVESVTKEVPILKPTAVVAEAPKAKKPPLKSASSSTKPPSIAQATPQKAAAQSSQPDDISCPRCGHEQNFTTSCGLCKMDLSLHIMRLKRRDQAKRARLQRQAQSQQVASR